LRLCWSWAKEQFCATSGSAGERVFVSPRRVEVPAKKRRTTMSDKTNPKTLSAMSVLLVCIQCAITAGRPIYTDANGPPGGDGSSWGTAYKYLQDAMADAASNPDPNDIWVAQGIYKPDRDTAHPSGTGARTATFGLVSSVAVYGGFPAGGGGWGDRDPQAHETLLSGDVGVVGDHSDNSYHVVTGSGADSTAVLDGFVVTGGRADGPWEDNHDKGAGMYTNNGSPVLANCTFTENWAQQDGGGLWSNDRDLVLTDCTFGENSAQRDGGGLWNNSRSLTLTNCTFGNNWAGRDGGGMWNKSSQLVVTNCTFSENSAEQDGGAMRNDSSSLTLTDCSFSRNSAGRDGGAMWNQSSTLNVNNCTFTANSAQNDGGGMWNQGSRLTMTDCTFRRNSAQRNGGGMWNEGSRLTVTNSTFIANSAQQNGGGMWNNGSRLALTECTFSDNSAGSNGGALYCYYTTTTINNCTFSNNTEDAIWVEGEVARIMGTVRVVSNNLAGSGTLHIEPDATLSLDDSLILCSLSGTGTIQTDIDSELVIKGDAVIDLGDPNDPNANGQLQGGRLLRVEDNVQISNANIDVNQASLEGNTVFTHSKFTIGPLAPYGQFSVDPNVSITYCDFHVYGDRYTDIYPKFFAGEFLNNRLFVTITEGVGQARGGLYECRGDPAFAQPDFAQPCCDSNGFTCCMDPNDIPDCNLRTWTVERMELIKGAKVTVTNRYAFQAPYDPGNDDEVLYVKELILREDSVFNTAYNWAYYGSLQAEPNAVITDVPLLGFSLITIDFNDMLEFIIRVTHNNYEHPTDPALDRQHVRRIEGNEPDPNGMMEMRVIEDLDPNSVTKGEAIAAVAKGTFAKANEEHVLITFEYKFVEDPCDEAELIVYLSDQPGLDVNLVEVARIRPPDPNRRGSVISTELATFSGTFPRGALNFNRGTYVALELRGRGARCWIDDWDPSVSCTKPKCGDYGQPFGSINVIDFLLLLADFGLTNPASVGKGCLDLVGDGCINNDDLLVWDIVEKDNKCPLMLAAASGPPSAAAESWATVSGWQSTAELPPLLVFGKPGGPGPGTPPGYLYGLDSNATCVGEAIEAQGNSRLVTDSLGNVYQINSNVGLMPPQRLLSMTEITWSRSDSMTGMDFCCRMPRLVPMIPISFMWCRYW
jgi:predicted outer membrane repeat protein